MDMPQMAKTAPAAPPLDLTAVVRYRLHAAWIRIGARRTLIALGLAAVAAGLALNWSWLTAIGVAPVLVAAAPCAVMCALGLCMPRMIGGNSCVAGQGANDAVDQIAGHRPDPNLPIQPSEIDPTRLDLERK